MDSWRTPRIIDHDEAREIASRLINSHFRKEPQARVGIPARPDYDDDLLISTYICQQRERDDSLRARCDALALQVLVLEQQREPKGAASADDV
jgi:hypothetical protein